MNASRAFRASRFLLSLCAFVPACTQQDHYIIASTGTVIGVEVAQHPANQTPQAKLGYNRSELALVPTTRPPCAIRDDKTIDCGTIEDGGDLKDVPDVLMELRYGGIFDLGGSSGIHQRLAVGRTAVRQPGAALMFAKDSDGGLDAATATGVARANLLGTIDQAEYDALVAQAKKERDVRQDKIDEIIAEIRQPGDPTKVDPAKLADLLNRTEIDPSGTKATILRGFEDVENLRDFLDIPAKEYVDPLFGALGAG